MTAHQQIQRILIDPCAHYWLKSALQDALTKDPVDAANDAELLAQVLAQRASEILGVIR